jgi:RimJ/RimL family protein N-acetyltransferase
MHRIGLRVYEFNRPAIRCYEKAGFKTCGRMREAKRIAGKWYDEIHMDILEDEFVSPLVKPAVLKRSGSQ